jgi:hypothetical protein
VIVRVNTWVVVVVVSVTVSMDPVVVKSNVAVLVIVADTVARMVLCAVTRFVCFAVTHTVLVAVAGGRVDNTVTVRVGGTVVVFMKLEQSRPCEHFRELQLGTFATA